jgi:hypothetical protein
VLSTPLFILVADSDPVVGVVSARLLSSALEAQATSLLPVVRVLATQDYIDRVYEPKLPLEVQAISQHVFSASAAEIVSTNLIVGFSGVDQAAVEKLRNSGLTAPAVGLCQFVLNLNEMVKSNEHQKTADVREVLVGAALQFGFAGGSTQCPICADKVDDSIDYWINIADSCSNFARHIQLLQS